MSGRLTRGFYRWLALMSAVVVLFAAADGYAAKKKKPRKKPAPKPAIAAPKEPAPVIQPLSTPTPAPAPAPAAAVPDKGPRSIAVIVEGTNARDLDALLKQTFGSQVAIAIPSTVRAAVSNTDQRIFGRPTKQSDLVKAAKRVAKKAGVDAVVYANVGGSASQGYTAAVLVVYRNGRVGVDGSVPVTRLVKRGGRATLSWQLANVTALVQPGIDELLNSPGAAPTAGGQPSAQGGMSLGDALANFEAGRTGSAPRAGGPAPVSSASEDNDKREDDPQSEEPVREVVQTVEDTGPHEHLFDRRMRTPLIVKLGIEGAHREFAYNQPITANLRDYSVGVAPLANFEVEAYPFGNTNIAVLKNLSWYGQYSRAFGVQSSFRTVTAENDVRVNNNWSTWQVGVHSRFRLGNKLAIGPQATYGFSAYRFEFADIADQRAFEVPDVRYNFLRFGLEARVPVAILDLAVGAGYRNVMSGGRVASQYFPNASSDGFDAHATIGLPISKSFALDGTVRYVRYFYSMNPEVSDTYVAGGALDQYMMASLSIVYLMGGHGE